MTPTQLGPRLAEGRTAEIYAWEDGWVLKLFRPGWDTRDVEYETTVTLAARDAGFEDAPRVREMIQVDGRTGIVMERVDGLSLAADFFAHPWRLFSMARLMAELHAGMHACAAPGLPSQRQKLIRKIQNAPGLSQAHKEGALRILSDLPDDNAVCHGDFHPENVLLTATGPRVIDWVDAVAGHPFADVARTLLLLINAPLYVRSAAARVMIRAALALFRSAYLRRYFALRPGGRETLARWMIPIAAARLTERIPEEERALIARVEAGLR